MSLRKNIIANYAGGGWVAFVQLIFIPVYINYLGLEAYGLIGVFALIQTVAALLDIGMTPTLTREMARFTAGDHTPLSVRTLLLSLETVSVGLAILILACIWLTSDWIALHWLQVGNLPIGTVSSSIRFMGIVVALHFIENIYRGSIMGLQTHVWLNGVSAAVATARGLGAIAVLAWVSPTIEAFFIWQACVSVAVTAIFCLRVHNYLPSSPEPVRFSWPSLLKVWAFARGMIATTFLSLLLTQGDKLILSKLLSLETFGSYVIAATVSNALMIFVAPIAQSYYPLFTELVARHEHAKLTGKYHEASQLVAIAVVPIAVIMILHSETLLLLWTHDAALAHRSGAVLAILALGTAFLGIMNVPYMLQLAFGWSMLAAKVNAVVVLIQFPMLYWAITNFGAIGAAWIWAAVTFTYIVVVIQIMHARLLPGEKWRWYWRDTALPVLVAGTAGLLLDLFTPARGDWVRSLSWLVLNYGVMFAAALLSCSDIRSMVRDKLFKLSEKR